MDWMYFRHFLSFTYDTNPIRYCVVSGLAYITQSDIIALTIGDNLAG